MNDLTLRITRVVSEGNFGALSLIGKMSLENNEDMAFAILIREQVDDNPNSDKVKNMLGEDLFNEMMENM